MFGVGFNGFDGIGANLTGEDVAAAFCGKSVGVVVVVAKAVSLAEDSGILATL